MFCRTTLVSSENPASLSCSDSGVGEAHVLAWLTPFRRSSSTVWSVMSVSSSTGAAVVEELL